MRRRVVLKKGSELLCCARTKGVASLVCVVILLGGMYACEFWLVCFAVNRRHHEARTFLFDIVALARSLAHTLQTHLVSSCRQEQSKVRSLSSLPSRAMLRGHGAVCACSASRHWPVALPQAARACPCSAFVVRGCNVSALHTAACFHACSLLTSRTRMSLTPALADSLCLK